MTQKRERIGYIDAAKGLAIILVIVGHSRAKNIPYLWDFIYSFHMPLFVIISGFFIKENNFYESIKKYARNYLKPYFVTSILGLFIALLVSTIILPKEDIIKIWFIRFLYASSGCPSIYLSNIPIMGPIWFLWSLFWGCLIYTLIKRRFHGLGACITFIFIATFGIYSSKIINLPLSFQSGCFFAAYIAIGNAIWRYDIINTFQKCPWYIHLLCVILWGISIYSNGFNLGACYTGSPLNLIMSVISCLIIISFLNKLKIGGGWIGRSTLSILCAHSLFHYILYVFGHPHLTGIPKLDFLITASYEITIALGGAYFLQNIPILRTIFKSK